MFSNLFRNAAEAAEGAGRVPRIRVTGQVDAARSLCMVRVEDNGPGIPIEIRDNVFDPFFTTRPSGTGLGLAMVQQIVTQHGGRIEVDESPLGGARFKLHILCAEPETNERVVNA